MKKLLISFLLLASCPFYILAQEDNRRKFHLPDSLPKCDLFDSLQTGKRVYNAGHLLVLRVSPTYNGHLLVKTPDDDKATIRIVPPPPAPGVRPFQPGNRLRIKPAPRKQP